MSELRYEDFLRLCPELKKLKIGYTSLVGNNWLHQKYPNLKHVINGEMFYGDEDWGLILKQNQNVQMFQCIQSVLLENVKCKFFVGEQCEALVDCELQLSIEEQEEIDAVANLKFILSIRISLSFSFSRK